MDKKLDNFESFIKDSMESFEAPYNGASWSAIEKSISTPSKFESFVKESMENYEAAYNPSSWTAVEKALNSVKAPFYKSFGFIGGVAALLVAGIVYFSLPENTNNNEIANHEANIDVTPRDYKVDNNTNTNNSINNNSTTNHNLPVDGDRDYVADNNEANPTIVHESNEAIADKLNGKTLENKEAVGKEDPKIKVITPTNPVSNVPNIEDKSSVNPENPKNDSPRDYALNFNVNANYCEGDKINLSAKADNGQNLTYAWFVNGNPLANSRDYSFNAKPGKTSIKLVAKNNGKIVDEVTKEVQVATKPSGSLTLKEDDRALINQFEFGLDQEYKNVTWNFGDGEVSTNQDAIHSYPKQASYNMSCIIKNEAGCETKLEKSITVAGYYNIRKEHFFSPDGDGSLDIFMPEELTVINQPFTMNIHSRSGELLYQTTNLNNGWDGKNANGTLVPFGAYVWVIKLTNELGHEEVYKGTVVKASH